MVEFCVIKFTLLNKNIIIFITLYIARSIINFNSENVSVGKYVKHIDYVNSIATVTIVTPLHVSLCLFTYIAIVSETSTKMADF